MSIGIVSPDIAAVRIAISISDATSLVQEVGEGLGAQAGERSLTEVLTGAGFTRVRRATEGPFNMVLEAGP